MKFSERTRCSLQWTCFSDLSITDSARKAMMFQIQGFDPLNGTRAQHIAVSKPENIWNDGPKRMHFFVQAKPFAANLGLSCNSFGLISLQGHFHQDCSCQTKASARLFFLKRIVLGVLPKRQRKRKLSLAKTEFAVQEKLLFCSQRSRLHTQEICRRNLPKLSLTTGCN